jgi:O-antigen/teichoic acid export membrane protein
MSETEKKGGEGILPSGPATDAESFADALIARLYAMTPWFVRRPWEHLHSTPLGARLTHGTVWSFLSLAVSNGMPLLAGIFTARMLGQKGYGELGMIVSTLGMFVALGGFGLSATAIKYIAELRIPDPPRAGRILTLTNLAAWVTGSLAAVVLLVIAPALIGPSLANDLRIGAVMVLGVAIAHVQSGALAGLEAFKKAACASFLAGILNFVCLVGGCWVGGLTGTVWGLGLAVGFNALINHWFLSREARRQQVPFWCRGWASELGLLWKCSLPVVLGSALGSPVHWLTQWILFGQSGGDAALAVYRVGFTWSLVVSLIPLPFCYAYIPVLSSLAEDAADSRRKLIWKAVLGSLAIAVPVGLVLVLLAGPILSMYGPEYVVGRSVFSVLMVCGAAESVIALLIATLLALGFLWWRLGAMLVWAVTVSGLALALVPMHGAMGIALSLLVGHVVLLVLLMLILVKALRTKSPVAQKSGVV